MAVPECKKSQHCLAFFDIIKPERNSLEIVRNCSEITHDNYLSQVISSQFLSVEELVPLDHLLCKIDSAVDFTHIYDFVEDRKVSMIGINMCMMNIWTS